VVDPDPREVKLVCSVQIAEPGDDTAMRWKFDVRGTGVQVGARLDELATRIEGDPDAPWETGHTSCAACGTARPGEFLRCAFAVDVRWPDGRTLTAGQGCMRPLTVALLLRSFAGETRSEVMRAALNHYMNLAEVLISGGKA
jgi:hypothetical protein